MKRTLIFASIAAGIAVAVSAAAPLAATAATSPEGYTPDLERRGFPSQYSVGNPDTPFTSIFAIDKARMAGDLKWVVPGNQTGCTAIASATIAGSGLGTGGAIASAGHWDTVMAEPDLGVTSAVKDNKTTLTYYSCPGVKITVLPLKTFDGPSGVKGIGPDVVKPKQLSPENPAPIVVEPSIPSEPLAPQPEATPAAPTPVAPAPAEPTPVVTAPATPPVDANPVAPSLSAVEKTIAVLVNKERAAAGLAPVTVRTELSDASRTWSTQMGATGVFEHSSIDANFTYYKVIPKGWTWAAENIVYTTNPTDLGENMMRLWMNSPGHRKNILDPRATTIGVGVTEKDGRFYGTQVFAAYP